MDHLEEAKRQAGSIDTETTATSENPSPLEDANTAERKLRQQTHLHIKLAAAKMAAVVEEREESLWASQRCMAIVTSFKPKVPLLQLDSRTKKRLTSQCKAHQYAYDGESSAFENADQSHLVLPEFGDDLARE